MEFDIFITYRISWENTSLVREVLGENGFIKEVVTSRLFLRSCGIVLRIVNQFWIGKIVESLKAILLKN